MRLSFRWPASCRQQPPTSLPDAAYALVVRASLPNKPRPKPDEAGRGPQGAGAPGSPGAENARWAYALAHIANDEAEQATGEAAKDKRKEALEKYERAAELQPNDAEGQVWLASACFDRIDDVGMLSKMSLVSEGRKAFEKAIAIDPNNVAARVGLAQFYVGAPGIAGGSVAKAKAQGDALLGLSGKRGEFQGRMVLAGVAAQQSWWTARDCGLPSVSWSQPVFAQPCSRRPAPER